MPYTMDNMPESMKGAPKHAMEIFIAAFNTAFEKNHVEGAAMAIAMAAVHKAGYKKDENGKWIPTLNPSQEGNNHSETYPLWVEHKWIPVFEAGIHTDMNGNTKEWTEADLDYMVSTYDPDKYEAPEVIGHPETGSPAWGWVEALKREGKYLFAMAKDRVPEFVELIKKKMYKTRSISVYPDGRFRNLGWLGATPPAVKGLPNAAFKDGEKSINIEFGDFGGENSKPQTLNSKLFRKEAKRMKWFDWMKKKAADEGVTIEDAPTNFSASNPPPAPPPAGDIKALVDAEVAKHVAAKNAEFAEQGSKLKAEGERLKAEGEKLETAKRERQKDEIKSFCECLCREGKLTPAMVKYGMGMTNFLEAISGIQTQYDFCEPTEGKKLTPVEHAKGFLSCFKKQIGFGEFAGNEKDFKAGGNAGEKLSALTKKKMEDKKDMTYAQAFSEVQTENPQLAQEYAIEIGG